MTQQQKNLDGHGGSTVVDAAGKVEHKKTTINPGDPGYQEAVRKAAVESEKHPGTLNRAPTFRDLTKDEPEAPKKPERAQGSSASSATTKENK